MIDSIGTKAAVNVSLSPAVQFYSIELMPLFDGQLSVGVMAILCEDDGELESMDMGSHRVASLDEALAVIRNAVAV